MKKTIETSVKQLLGDRAVMILAIIIFISVAVYCIYVALSVSPTELQIATRYSAFGETQYYRNKWYYLLTFIGFAVVLGLTHVSLMAKLLGRGMRPHALGVGFLSLILIGILFLITHSVLDVAYLS